jgi:hypothetical protein
MAGCSPLSVFKCCGRVTFGAVLGLAKLAFKPPDLARVRLRVELAEMPAVKFAQPPGHRRIKRVVMQPRLPVFFQCLPAFAEIGLLHQQAVGH